MRAEKKIIFFPLAALLLAGCPDTVGQPCPPNAVAIGTYALYFQGQHPADECRVLVGADGGPADAAVTLDDGGTHSGTLCSATGPDGGLLLYLALPLKAPRQSSGFNDGGFQFVNHTDLAQGSTVCGCPLGVDESFNGVLTGAWDGGFPTKPDGGLPLVTGLTGLLVDQYTAAGSPCLCNMPCTVTYSILGARF
jgi:hypothetical protein